MIGNRTPERSVLATGMGGALRVLATRGAELFLRYRLPWSEAVQELTRATAFEEGRRAEPLVKVALVGGASSGKSTAFNNLLGGHYTSQVQVHSHTTLGPILAVHVDRRDQIEQWIRVEKALMPALEPQDAGIEDCTAGQVGRLTIVEHQVDGLRDILLFDVPDFTSESARREGDLTLCLLPWFDRLIVMLDCERWSDRQSQSELARRAEALGQSRFAVFNCTEEMADRPDSTLFDRQAATLGSSGWTYVEHRRGRGLRRLPSPPLEAMVRFATQPLTSRLEPMMRQLGRKANAVLNAQEQRAHALVQLKNGLNEKSVAAAPTPSDCLQAMMSDSERSQLRLLTRIMGVSNAGGQWVQGLRSMLWNTAAPFKDLFSGKSSSTEPALAAAQRVERGLQHFDDQCRHIWRRLQGLAVGSGFQRELEQDGIRDGFGNGSPPVEPLRTIAAEKLTALDEALALWNRKVEQECRGLSPRLYGAAGGAMLGVAVVLIAVQGPVSLLTFPAAMAAISASVTKLAMAAGAGALLGKQAGRLTLAVQERWLGSPELSAVRNAAEAYREQLTQYADRSTQLLIESASRFVLASDDPLITALESIRLAGDDQ